LSDHEAKLQKRLDVYGRVVAELQLGDGSVHRVEREYNPAAGNPFHNVAIPPNELLRCHFLSQGEIVRMAESEDEQIRFIDSFFDFQAHQRGIDETREALGILDHDVADQIRARKSRDQLLLEQQSLKAEIAAKETGLKTPIFGKYQRAQAKSQSIERALQAIDLVARAAAQARNLLEAVPAPPPASAEVEDDAVVRRLQELTSRAKTAVRGHLTDAVDAVASLQAEATADAEAWAPLFEAVADEYSEAVRQSGGDVAVLSQERAQLMKRLDEVERRLNVATQTAALLTPTVDERNNLLTQLRDRQSAYTNARQERCEWFERKSNGQIRAAVSAGSNRADFRQRLEAMKRGSHLTAPEIDSIATTVSPDDFVTALLRYDLSGQETDLDGLATASTLKRSRVVTLADFLLGDAGYEALLELQYGVTPTDRPEIAFQRQDGTFAPLSELSTGQKCTAFLVMALCEGDAPIVVDQPEDSLDIRSIWADMCLRLRSSKRDRQFAFTTHNSSLAVASDSDKFVVLTADAHHGEVVRSGAIDSEEVRREVIELLEGGQSTYFLKQRKYNVSDPTPITPTEPARLIAAKPGAEAKVGQKSLRLSLT
jgi:hypothetical protein